MKLRGIQYTKYLRVAGRMVNDVSSYTAIGGMMREVLLILQRNFEERGW